MPQPLLTVKDLGYRYPGAAAPALSDLCFAVGRGECLCLTGDSGCGKSTLLLALAGLLRGGAREGGVEFSVAPGRGGHPGLTGIVFQNPEAQMLCTSVAEEVAFGPENICVPPGEIGHRVASALEAVGLSGYGGRSTERFSAGQKQRVAIASALSLQPGLLLLDEPTSQLDAPGKRQLAAILAGLKGQGHTLLIAEHDPRPFASLIDRYLVLEQGALTAASAALPSPERYASPDTQRTPSRALRGEAALEVAGLSLSYPEAGGVLDRVGLRVLKGERVHLFGANGAGKSSLLRCLAGLENPDGGSVTVAGMRAPQPGRLPGKVGVLFQNPARQLFAESVAEEVVFTLRRMGLCRESCAGQVAEALSFCGISHLAGRVPLTLSFGEQHRVALAAVLAPRPEILLLDEPFAGLDFPQRHSLLELLGRLPDRYGTTVLIASHDELPDQRWADRRFLLEGGSLAELP